MIDSLFKKIWYGPKYRGLVLWPFACFFKFIVGLRKWWLCHFYQTQFNIPVIVVGNLTVGGVGKTPLVIALAKAAVEKKLKVAIVSRGYGAKLSRYPYLVKLEDSAQVVGDEPLLIVKKTHCPLMIGPNRVQAIQSLLKEDKFDLIISDDGLQHYRMGRSLEIVVMDGQRGFGNGFYLPAGPLREGPKRLNTADIVVMNGEGKQEGAFVMQFKNLQFTSVQTGEVKSMAEFEKPSVAIAGIGHPERFFNSLRNLGFTGQVYAFPDHYSFEPKDLNKLAAKTIIMTEKDAVKCQAFAGSNCYALAIEAELPAEFWQAFWSHPCFKGYL